MEVEPSPCVDSTHTKRTSCFSTQKKLFTLLITVTVAVLIVAVLIAAVVLGGLLYIYLPAIIDKEINRQFNASLQGRIDEALANHSCLCNLRVLGRTNEEANITLPDNFVKLVQGNFTVVSDRIRGSDSSLQDHISATNTTFTLLQEKSARTFSQLGEWLKNITAETRRNVARLTNSQANFSRQLELVTEELARQITQLEDATESIDFTIETRKSVTTLTNSLVHFSSDLRELELDTSRKLNLLDSSVHQALSESLLAFRAETHSLVNSSTAEVLLHIKNEIMDVRMHIGDQVSEIRSHIDNQVSEVRDHFDSQVSEVRQRTC